VLVQFSEGHHNVEVLPAYEEDDGTFTIPNSEGGGSWEKFGPRSEVEKFTNSNTSTGGLTADLARMLKTWIRNTLSCPYKSYQLLNDVINYLAAKSFTAIDYSEYSGIVKDFFGYLKWHCTTELQSHVETAQNRAGKACDYEEEGKCRKASEEWQKIFGKEFPLAEESTQKDESFAIRTFYTPSKPYGYSYAI
jgi:hypothetical protein